MNPISQPEEDILPRLKFTKEEADRLAIIKTGILKLVDEKWVKWILSRLEDVNSQIALKEISETLDPAQKAQLMIGYYARIENTRPQANTNNKEETKHE